MKPYIAIIAILLLSSCAAKAAPWTPDLVTATQSSFELPGEWNFTARSGSTFGATCDLLFDRDGTYRKSCRPPAEESGDWKQVGEWDGRTLKVQLSDRVNQLEKVPIDDVTLTVSVETSDHRLIMIDGEPYDRK